MPDQIIVRGARLHNLKNISVAIPKNQLVVFTGVSGSGKSTLGFDILLMEGIRQYMESMGMITYGTSRPPVDSISGLSPSLAIDQHLTNRSPRSTVGTSTSVYSYLRLLYARTGHRPCPNCGMEVPPASGATGAEWEDESGESEDTFFPCPHCGAPVRDLRMGHFSFNKPEGACPTCAGLGVVRGADLKALVDESKSLPQGAVLQWNKVLTRYNLPILLAAAAHYGFDLDLAGPVRGFTPVQRDLLFHGVESPQFRRHFPNVKPPSTVRQGRFEGIATSVLRRHAEHLSGHVNEAGYRDKLEDLLITGPCPDCSGTRLNPESRRVTVNRRTILEAARLSLEALGGWLKTLPDAFTADEMLLAGPILEDLQARLARLVQVGAGYLSLDQASTSLSAGESQRLRLASLLGSELSGLLYVFDEPTIGLHHRDTRRLIEVLRRLRDLGNTVLVIEHDLEVINAADHVVDFGPGAGRHGGRVVAEGQPADLARHPDSLTGAYLASRLSIPVPAQRRAPGEQALVVRGAREHNLQDLTVKIPLGLLVAVTGVSGSGKSSLVFDILDRALHRDLHGSNEPPGEYDSIEGVELLDKVITIDQAHLARMPRSNAATYAEVFTPIREAFAASPGARQRGLSARHFSFNVPGGRCERCEGAGVLTVKMQFLPDVEVRCPVCHGRRFTPEVLAVQFRGQDISQVLEMTVEEALALFEGVPGAASRLQVLADVGLGYLQLGQPATTLSGGEAQRVKLAKELGRRAAARTLYLLDEPTTGLHLADTARLLGVLQRLVEAGNSVIVVEHNLELVKAADWVIDLGPEGGAQGGRLIAEGTPEQVAQTPGSFTGEGLRELV